MEKREQKGTKYTLDPFEANNSWYKKVITQWNTVRGPQPPQNLELVPYAAMTLENHKISKQRPRGSLVGIHCGAALFPSHPSRFLLSFKPVVLNFSGTKITEGLIKQFAGPTLFLIYKVWGWTHKFAFLTKWTRAVMLWFCRAHSGNHCAEFFPWPNRFLPILWLLPLSPDKSSFSHTARARAHTHTRCHWTSS